MSQAINNELPVELLSQVFDLLQFQDRQSATAVCSLWSEILSEARYLRRTTFHVGSYLSQGHSVDEVVRHYPVVEIGVVTEENVLQQIRDFLFDEKVASNLVAIYLNKFNHSVSEIFEDFPTFESTLNLPKLEEIKFERCVKPSTEAKPEIIAPQLKTLELTSENCHYAGDMVMPFVGQIEEMNLQTSIKVCRKFLSKATNLRRCTLINNGKTANLRRCTLINNGKMSKKEIKALKEAFRTLEKLNIDISGKYAVKNLKDIHKTAQSLKFLTITSPKFNINSLPPMVNLQTLDVLFIPAQCFETSQQLVLPNLWNLRTIMSATKKFIVPNLRSLTLIADGNGMLESIHINHFSNQLEELYLLDVRIESECINVIAQLPRLKHLKLYRVMVKDSEVTELMDGLRSLRWARFDNCVPMEKSCKCDDYKEFFEGLKGQYENISVSAVTNMMQCIYCDSE